MAMADPGVPEVEIMEQIDWENLFDSGPGSQNFFDPEIDSSFLPDFPVHGSIMELRNPQVSRSIEQIEQMLMKDDNDREEAVVEEPDHEFLSGFLADILVDSPVQSDLSGEVVDVLDGKNSNSSLEEKIDYILEEKKNNNNISNGDDDPISSEEEKIDDILENKKNNSGSSNNNGDDDDPILKKRKRQLRNRDAAVKSRERKKMYVRDLELKSRYLEGECRRLGMLLQCCFAENQALHLSLQNGNALDASRTKQESAVLLLESLLLGSLLWFLGIMCVLLLPRWLLSTVGVVPPESVDIKSQGRVAPGKVGSKMFGLKVTMGKRCKASRSRMKASSLCLEILVRLVRCLFVYLSIFYVSFTSSIINK